MKVQFLKALLKKPLYPIKKGKKSSGFTILELLIATLIATMVVIALLNIVVELLQTDRREYARNETQREMQMALDYMVNDLREAAYVYNQDELNGSNGVSQFLNLPTGFTPILAFWKPETISDTDLNKLATNTRNCTSFSATDPKRSECEQLIVRRRALSLVVYLQKVNDASDLKDGWKGISRIARFQFNKYTLNGIANLQQTPGYADPQENTITFASWPYPASSSTNQRTGTAVSPAGNNAGEGTTQVLVDFLDFPTSNRSSPLYSDNLTSPANPQCPNNTNYSQIPPKTGATFNNPSFMICVSTNNTVNSGADLSNTNQDVLIFLRGNPTGKAGVKIAPLLAVKTQAVARGVVNKQPQ